MLRARRVAFVAVLALVGGLALTGCRSQPGVAVYVGSARYTQKYVDGLADQLAYLPETTKADTRVQVVKWLIQRDLDRRIAARNHWAVPAADVAAATSSFAQSLQVKDAAEARKVVASAGGLIKLFAEYRAVDSVTSQHAAASQPSQAEITDFYERAKAAGVVQGGEDIQTFLQGLNQQQQEEVLGSLGLKKLYAAEVKKTKVTINPKYGSADLVLLPGGDRALIDVPLQPHGAGPAVVPAPVDTSAARAPSGTG